MIVAVAGDGRFELRDPLNFRELKVLAAESFLEGASRAIVGLGDHDGEGHAWLSIAMLEAAVGASQPDDQWTSGWSAMIDYAEQKGWVSAEGSLVRAHIESA